MKYQDCDPFTRAYIDCALWSSSDQTDDQGGEPLDRNYSGADLPTEKIARMAADCARFQEVQADDLSLARSADYNGHDFWLTRNGHGAGFWDRGLGEVGERLSLAARAFGTSDLCLGDDGKIYVSPA